MSRDDENIYLALEVNRAMHNKDAAQLIKSIARFMEHNELRVDEEALTQIPGRSPRRRTGNS